VDYQRFYNVIVCFQMSDVNLKKEKYKARGDK